MHTTKIPKIGYCGQHPHGAIFVKKPKFLLKKPEHGTSYLLHFQFNLFQQKKIDVMKRPTNVSA